jgi:hypothetical protein
MPDNRRASGTYNGDIADFRLCGGQRPCLGLEYVVQQQQIYLLQGGSFDFHGSGWPPDDCCKLLTPKPIVVIAHVDTLGLLLDDSGCVKLSGVVREHRGFE